LPAGLQQAHSIAPKFSIGVHTQSIREIAPRSFLSVKDFLLIPSERPIGVKNIRRLARKPSGKALRAKAKSTGILKRAQLGFAILHATQQRRNLFCNDTLHSADNRTRKL
jgi:hypothetical protein